VPRRRNLVPGRSSVAQALANAALAGGLDAAALAAFALDETDGAPPPPEQLARFMLGRLSQGLCAMLAALRLDGAAAVAALLARGRYVTQTLLQTVLTSGLDAAALAAFDLDASDGAALPLEQLARFMFGRLSPDLRAVAGALGLADPRALAAQLAGSGRSVKLILVHSLVWRSGRVPTEDRVPAGGTPFPPRAHRPRKGRHTCWRDLEGAVVPCLLLWACAAGLTLQLSSRMSSSSVA
jgi:hypothetical protein